MRLARRPSERRAVLRCDPLPTSRRLHGRHRDHVIPYAILSPLLPCVVGMMTVMAQQPHAMVWEHEGAAVANPRMQAAMLLGARPASITFDVAYLPAVLACMVDYECIGVRDHAWPRMGALELDACTATSKRDQDRRFGGCTPGVPASLPARFAAVSCLLTQRGPTTLAAREHFRFGRPPAYFAPVALNADFVEARGEVPPRRAGPALCAEWCGDAHLLRDGPRTE
jgi:hypothetical protein